MEGPARRVSPEPCEEAGARLGAVTGAVTGTDVAPPEDLPRAAALTRPRMAWEAPGLRDSAPENPR